MLEYQHSNEPGQAAYLILEAKGILTMPSSFQLFLGGKGKRMKDVYYFSHDSAARRDPKIVALMSKYGPAGYGVFFILIEILSEQHGYKIEKFPRMVDGLAKEAGTDSVKLEEILSYIIQDCELLKQDERYIWSESLNRRKEHQELKRQAKIEAGRIGGYRSGQSRAQAKQSPNEIEAERKQNEAMLQLWNQSKVKQSKVKESKDTTPILLPDWISKEVWEGFKELRKKKNAPLTDMAIKLITGKLSKFKEQGYNPNSVLEQSIEKGWTGVFPLKSGFSPHNRELSDAEKAGIENRKHNPAFYGDKNAK